MINKCTPPQNQRGPRGAAVSRRLGVGALAGELSHCGAVPRFHFPLFLGASARSLAVLSLTSHTRVCAKPLQWYLTLQEPRGCSPPGSSVHGILQARIRERVFLLQVIFTPRDQACVSPKAPALRHRESPSYFMDSIKKKSWVPCQGKKKSGNVRRPSDIVWRTSCFSLPQNLVVDCQLLWSILHHCIIIQDSDRLVHA